MVQTTAVSRTHSSITYSILLIRSIVIDSAAFVGCACGRTVARSLESRSPSRPLRNDIRVRCQRPRPWAAFVCRIATHAVAPWSQTTADQSPIVRSLIWSRHISVDRPVVLYLFGVGRAVARSINLVVSSLGRSTPSYTNSAGEFVSKSWIVASSASASLHRRIAAPVPGM